MTDADGNVYLVWGKLNDPRLIGYNIYYGTVPGRYIQRRTLSAQDDGVTIRDLPIGKQYFFAVTGFDANQNETEFSFEVGVVVGDPTSSTAPFALTSDQIGQGTDGGLAGSVIGDTGSVPGGTGLPLPVLIATLLTAGASSALYMRYRKNKA